MEIVTGDKAKTRRNSDNCSEASEDRKVKESKPCRDMMWSVEERLVS